MDNASKGYVVDSVVESATMIGKYVQEIFVHIVKSESTTGVPSMEMPTMLLVFLCPPCWLTRRAQK